MNQVKRLTLWSLARNKTRTYLLIHLFCLCAIQNTIARSYYLDINNGLDKNPGTSITQAWKTISTLNQQSLSPGDSILLMRGCQWFEGIQIKSSGKENNPITIGTYGKGNAPMIGDTNSYGIKLLAPWVTIESLFISNTSKSGVFVTQSSGHTIVQDCEITKCGSGVELQGQNNLVRRNYIHDLKMIVNTQGGNDDYGAVGVWFENKNNEVCYNRFIRCASPSLDFGTDGGVVEWVENSDSCRVYNNLGIDCNSFLEVGKTSISSAVVSYNISINNGAFSIIHVTGTFAATLKNFKIENNTIIDTVSKKSFTWAILGFEGTIKPEMFFFRNNIVYVKDFQNVSPADKNNWQFTHTANLYYIIGPTTQIGFKLDPSEKIADPLFVNMAKGDFHITPQSPAVKAGIKLGYSKDYYYKPVPLDSPPDIGAAQHMEPVGVIKKIEQKGNHVHVDRIKTISNNRIKIKINNKIYDLQGRLDFKNSSNPELNVGKLH